MSHCAAMVSTYLQVTLYMAAQLREQSYDLEALYQQCLTGESPPRPFE